MLNLYDKPLPRLSTFAFKSKIHLPFNPYTINQYTIFLAFTCIILYTLTIYHLRPCLSTTISAVSQRLPRLPRPLKCPRPIYPLTTRHIPRFSVSKSSSIALVLTSGSRFSSTNEVKPPLAHRSMVCSMLNLIVSPPGVSSRLLLTARAFLKAMIRSTTSIRGNVMRLIITYRLRIRVFVCSAPLKKPSPRFDLRGIYSPSFINRRSTCYIRTRRYPLAR